MINNDNKPLFTLTPEDAELVGAAFKGIIPIWEAMLEFYDVPQEKTKMESVHNLYKRIKEFQDEKGKK